jgi:glutathione S-transferase
MTVKLYGYRYSVYTWIARLALQEKGVGHESIEIDPFSDTMPSEYLSIHPFRRVPALAHGSFVVYETSAITRHVDETFSGPVLQPTETHERARCNQIISVVDSYAYWPLVRQVFSHGVFRPRMGRPADQEELRKGLDTALRVLSALEALASGGTFLCGDRLSLADIHLVPMIAYFSEEPGGKVLVDQHPRLSTWMAAMSSREAFRTTTPRLPGVYPSNSPIQVCTPIA